MRSAHSSPLSSSLSLRRIAACTLMAVTLLSACGKKDAAQAGPGAGAKMPAPEVGVVTAKFEPVALLTELPGRAEPSRTAQVRARAAGIVQQRLFREGSDVKAGPGAVPHRRRALPGAARRAPRPTWRAPRPTLGQATALAERYKPLVEANAISKQEYANAVAAQKQAEADVAAARAPGAHAADQPRATPP